MSKRRSSASEQSGYLLNLINAFEIHSPDSLYAAVSYLPLTGLSLPLLPMIAHWNDQIIEHGDQHQIKQLYAVLADATKYVQSRHDRLSPDPDKTSEAEQTLNDATEQVIGLLETVKIIARHHIDELIAECVQAIQSLIDDHADPQPARLPNQQALFAEFKRLQTELQNRQWDQANARLNSMYVLIAD